MVFGGSRAGFGYAGGGGARQPAAFEGLKRGLQRVHGVCLLLFREFYWPYPPGSRRRQWPRRHP